MSHDRRVALSRGAMGLSAIVIVIFPDITPLLFFKLNFYLLLHFFIFFNKFFQEYHQGQQFGSRSDPSFCLA